MQVLHDAPLKHRHTLAAPVVAKRLLIIDSIEDLTRLNQETIVIGGGSNIVFLRDIEATIAVMAIKGIEIGEAQVDTVLVKAMAGESWHAFVEQMVEQGLNGLENLALIPGTVGAAPVQNIGAYGVEVSDYIDNVEVYDRDSANCFTLPKHACGFAYRQSYFKTAWRERYIIVSVTFALKTNPTPNLAYEDLANHTPPLLNSKDVFDAVVRIRKDKLPDPDEWPNAGSFFHNPVVSKAQFSALKNQFSELSGHAVGGDKVKIPAAWLIEYCGFKGYREGGVGMYDKHALVLINYHGSGEDIKHFSQKIIDKVQATFGITLRIEPTVIGYEHATSH